MAGHRYLAVLDAYDPALPGVRTLYFASGAGFASGPGDTPPHTVFEPRLIQPVSIARTIHAHGTTHGASEIALGDLVLNNADGGLDGILSYGYDGRDLRVYVGEDGAAFPAGFALVFSGTMEQLEYDRTRITIRVRDRQYDAFRPLQPTLYAGDNALPAGVEGVAGDLKGTPKPLLFGRVYNAPATLVNSSRLIYQLHDGALQAIGAVYDKGKALTLGVAHASLAALEGATVAAGTYDTWLGGGMFRLGATPAGTVTADATEGATAADRTTGQVFRRVLLKAGIPAGSIDADAIAALDAANAAELGFFEREERTLAAALDEITASVGAWWGQTPDGLFTAEVFTAPSGVPVAEFSVADLLKLERLPSEVGAGLPVWRVTLGYERNYTVQDGDALDASVTAERRGWLARGYRITLAEDATVRTAHPNAHRDEVYTLLTDATAAATEAARVLALRSVRRDRYELRVWLEPERVAAIRLGSVVRVRYDRFGLQAGKLFRVTEYEPDARRGFLNLTVWG